MSFFDKLNLLKLCRDSCCLTFPKLRTSLIFAYGRKELSSVYLVFFLTSINVHQSHMISIFFHLFWYQWIRVCKCWTAWIVSGIWSTWLRSTWRNTMCVTGSEWLLQTRIEMFMNWGTSTLLRMRVRKKISCLITPYSLSVLFTLFL